ncbi:hypothetical protein HDU96_006060 [Phlyctochytrium bullatum]|nr:hypothetical protein HDU96_006060 [Phlyctochytrium bullatum]
MHSTSSASAAAILLLLASTAVIGPVDAILSPVSKVGVKGRFLRHLSPALNEVQVGVVDKCPWRWQVQEKETCSSIAIKLGVDISVITSNNPGFSCDNIKANDILCLSTTADDPRLVAVKSINDQSDTEYGAADNATFTCTAYYTTNGKETCSVIKQKNNVPYFAFLNKINPTLECFKGNVTAGNICIKASGIDPNNYKDPIIPRGSRPIPVADCTKTVPIRLNSTCDEIATGASIRSSVLFTLNMNLTCTQLTDNIGAEVCVASSGKNNKPTSVPLPSSALSTGSSSRTSTSTTTTTTSSTTSSASSSTDAQSSPSPSPSPEPSPEPSPTPSPEPTPEPTPEPQPQPQPPAGGGGQEADCLNLHNYHRSRIGMSGLYWDDGMAAEATDIARMLANQGCGLDHGDRQGENLFAARGSYPSDWCTKATRDWINEGYGPDSTWPGLNHASQLSWSSVQRLGCGYSYQQAYGCYVTACRYDPIGNMEGTGAYSPQFSSNSV